MVARFRRGSAGRLRMPGWRSEPGGTSLGPLGRWRDDSRQRSAGRLADDPVNDQSLIGLEALHGGLGERPVTAIDRPRALARPAQSLLDGSHPGRAPWICVARPEGDQVVPVPKSGRGRRADDPVRSQSLAGLEALHGGLGERPVAAIDRPRALARPAQSLLDESHPGRAPWICVARPEGDQASLGVGLWLTLGLGHRRGREQRRRRDQGDQPEACGDRMGCPLHRYLLVLEGIRRRAAAGCSTCAG